MNKVIAAFDGLNVSDSTIDYSVYLSNEFDAHIVATFLEDILYYGKEGSEARQLFEEDDGTITTNVVKNKKQLRDASILKVQKKFDANGVHYNIHKGELIALQALIRETHFADMVLIEEDESFSNWDKSKPSDFLKHLLAYSNCPVMVVPQEFKPVEKFIFAYDGSLSSTYAIKFFSYLFPTLKKQQVEILTVTEDKHSNHMPEYQLLKELLKRRYPVIQQSVIKSADTTNSLAAYLAGQTLNCMVILGSYQRNYLSRWLHGSTADALITRLDIPLFVAHK